MNELIMIQENNLFWRGILLTNGVVVDTLPLSTAMELTQQANVRWGCGNFVVTRQRKNFEEEE